MTKARSVQAALFLLFALLPLSWRGLDATAYSGWPALGFAVAYLLALGGARLRLALACLAALADPLVAQRLATLGAIGLGSGPADFAEYLRRERASMAALVREAGITMD